MTPESLKSKRLVGLFLLGFILFNYPIISLFNLDTYWFGIPVLYLYVFGSWFLLIMLIILITKFKIKPSPLADRPSDTE